MARLPSKLPTQDDLGAMPSGRTGRVIATFDTSAVGKGMASMGDKLASLGGVLMEQQDKESELEAERMLLEFENTQSRRLDDERRTLTGDPANFASNFRGGYDEGARDLFARARERGLSPRVLQRLDFGLQRGGERLQTSAFGHEMGQRSIFQERWGNDQLTALNNDYLNAPDDESRERIRQNALRIIETARRAGMSPAGENRLTDFLHGMAERDAENYAQTSPWAALNELERGDQRAAQPSTGQISDQGIAFLLRNEPGARTQQTPAEQAARVQRLRAETAPITAWIGENVTVPMTQLQYDALVAYGRMKGPDALNAALPSINEGNWGVLRQVIGAQSLEAMEQPVDPSSSARPTQPERPRSGSSIDPSTFRPLPNLRSSGPRQGNVEGIVFHHTAGSDLASALSTNRQVGTGANYYIDRDGTIHAGDDNVVMAHVQGRDSRGGRNGNHMHLDSANTIGVEIVARNEGDVTPEQRESARQLAVYLQGRYSFPAANIIGHGEIQGDGPQPILNRRAARQNDEGAVAAEIRQSLEGQEPPQRVAQGPTRVAQWRGTATDASPETGARLPAAPRDHNMETIGDMLEGRAPSNRFQSLTPERRRVLSNNIRNGLKNITRDEINGELEHIRRTGEDLRGSDGTTAWERARRIFVPNELAKIELAYQEARRTHAATAPLNNMSEEQARAHLDRLSPSGVEQGESYNVAARVQARAERDLDRIVEFRQRDSAQAVMGGRIRGSGTGRRLAVNADGTLATLPGDDDLRALPAQEVTNAFDILRRRYPEITINSDDDGNITISGADPERPESMQNIWRTIIDARLQAQDRLGMDRNPITRFEASKLLGLQRGEAARMEPDALMRRLRRAADVAYATYGETYGALAFDTAIKYSGLTGETARDAGQLVRSLFNGDRMTRPDVDRFMRLNQMDQETRLWLGTAPNEQRWTAPGARADYLGSVTGITRREMPFEGPGLSNVGDPRRDRPGIMHQTPSLDAGNAFSGLRPNQPYTGQAQRQFETPTPDEIEWLRANPDQWRLFDEDFGPGAAATYLQGEPAPRRRNAR